MLEPRRPLVAILATGGTIAGVQTTANISSYQAAAFSVDQLIEAVPPLRNVASIRAEQIANLGSQDMTHEVWLTLARRIDELCHDDAVDGIVITHGTDTIEETAYFLSMVVRHEKALVLVGAMRPATALSADGPANLYAAVALASHQKARGRGPLVLIMEPTFFSTSSTRHSSQSEFSLDMLHSSPWPRVEIISAYVGLDAELITWLARKADGIVLAGVGDGNASEQVLQALTDAASRGVAIVRASCVGKGSVARNIEVDDDARGFIAAGELNPSKARILLMLALFCNKKNPKNLQRIFDQY